MTEKKKRRKKHYLLRFVIVIVVLIGAWFVMHIDYFDVKGVAVIGNEDITDEEIMHLCGIETGKSIFDVHPMIVEHRVKKNLYIEDVKVDRKFPDEVEVKVTERSGNAQILKGKKYVVISGEGTVLEVSETERKATLIENITVVEAEKGDDIVVKEKEEETLAKALKFVKITEKGDLFFKKLSIEKNEVTAYVFDGLMCKGVYSDVTGSIRSGTLKSVIYDLYQKGTETGTINVYSNDYCFFTP